MKEALSQAFPDKSVTLPYLKLFYSKRDGLLIQVLSDQFSIRIFGVTDSKVSSSDQFISSYKNTTRNENSIK